VGGRLIGLIGLIDTKRVLLEGPAGLGLGPRRRRYKERSDRATPPGARLRQLSAQVPQKFMFILLRRSACRKPQNDAHSVSACQA